MVCPNCGRTLGIGEICQCQALNVARRDSELSMEAEDNKDAKRVERENKIKEKNEKIQAASQKADKAVGNVMNLFGKVAECFKHMDKVDELYIEKEEKSTGFILIVIHIILNILLVYIALTKSPLGLSFLASSVFKERVGSAMLIGSITIGMLPMFAKLGMMKYKADDKCVLEVSSEYIYTIPVTLLAIVVSLISPGFGLAFMLAIVVFGAIWTMLRLKKNGMEETRAVIATTICMLIVGLFTVLICALIA